MACLKYRGRTFDENRSSWQPQQQQARSGACVRHPGWLAQKRPTHTVPQHKHTCFSTIPLPSSVHEMYSRHELSARMANSFVKNGGVFCSDTMSCRRHGTGNVSLWGMLHSCTTARQYLHFTLGPFRIPLAERPILEAEIVDTSRLHRILHLKEGLPQGRELLLGWSHRRRLGCKQ